MIHRLANVGSWGLVWLIAAEVIWAGPAIQLSASVVGSDVYRIDAVTVAAVGPEPGSTILPDPNGSTRLTITGSRVLVERLTAGPASTIWRGQLAPLTTYGRLQVPGLELRWDAHDDEAIVGLGERFNGLNQAGRQVAMWISDTPGQAGGDSYFCAPILYSSHGYSIFAADNPEGVFDFNTDGSGQNSYRRAGRQVSFFLAFADSLATLVQKRAALQPSARTIPNWAWGPWISRNSFENQAEAEAALQGMRARDIPVSAIVLEAWKGRSEVGEYNAFSRERWPQLDAFLSSCLHHDVRVILWQLPVIHPSSPAHAEGVERGYFVKRPDGAVSHRRVWPEGFANIDFTKPDAVAWWQPRMRAVVTGPVAGFKTDDGEAIEPDDRFADGRVGWEMHNVYSRLYKQAVLDLLDDCGVEGLVWGRSGTLGIEQVPALWAGDQLATWSQLRSLIPAGLSASLSGMPFWGHDIGGYAGTPSPELYIRWLQFGAFSPLMQHHGEGPREPWHYGETAVTAYRKFAKLRMNLRPALAALGLEATTTGLPIMRPMAMMDGTDRRDWDEVTQYMLGNDLLVAPVMEAGAVGRTVSFPDGSWQCLDRPVAYDGPAQVYVPCGLLDAPVFVREGATLQVELDEGQRLGYWRRGAPVRPLTFEPQRATVRNPSTPAPTALRELVPDQWLVAGPYPFPDPSKGQASIGPLDPDVSPDAIRRTNVTWSASPPGPINLQQILGDGRDAFAYAVAEIVVPRQAQVRMICGSDDGMVVWVNGRKTIESYDWRLFQPDYHVATATFQTGTNQICCRIGQGSGAWLFQMQMWQLPDSY